MTTMLRITSALALALAAASSASASQYHGPIAANMDDATYFYEAEPSTAEVRAGASIDPATMKVVEGRGSIEVRQGDPARTRYDETSMQLVDVSTAHPMEQ